MIVNFPSILVYIDVLLVGLEDLTKYRSIA